MRSMQPFRDITHVPGSEATRSLSRHAEAHLFVEATLTAHARAGRGQKRGAPLLNEDQGPRGRLERLQNASGGTIQRPTQNPHGPHLTVHAGARPTHHVGQAGTEEEGAEQACPVRPPPQPLRRGGARPPGLSLLRHGLDRG